MGYAEANAALVAAARRNKVAGAEKKHATWLLYNVAVRRALGARVLGLAASSGCLGACGAIAVHAAIANGPLGAMCRSLTRHAALHL